MISVVAIVATLYYSSPAWANACELRDIEGPRSPIRSRFLRHRPALTYACLPTLMRTIFIGGPQAPHMSPQAGPSQCGFRMPWWNWRISRISRSNSPRMPSGMFKSGRLYGTRISEREATTSRVFDLLYHATLYAAPANHSWCLWDYKRWEVTAIALSD